jgi:ATP-dependent Clp protease adaptor protein ClpS
MLGGNDALRFPLSSMYRYLQPLLFRYSPVNPTTTHFTIILHFFKDLIINQVYFQIVYTVRALWVESWRLNVNVLTIQISKEDAMNAFKDSTIEQTQSAAKERTAEPPMYRVILYNDDFTPRVFVVEILVTLFHKGVAEATELMWRVHHGNRGVAGVYPREIAETKVVTAIGLARENGFPLKMSLEPDA